MAGLPAPPHPARHKRPANKLYERSAMSNIFSLDDLREEVEREFAPVTIELSDGTEVTLRNLLRLPKGQRRDVVDTLKVLEAVDGSDDSDVEELLYAATSVLEIVADHGKKLTKELDGDLAVTMKVLERWMEATQPGEAKRSGS